MENVREDIFCPRGNDLCRKRGIVGQDLEPSFQQAALATFSPTDTLFRVGSLARDHPSERWLLLGSSCSIPKPVLCFLSGKKIGLNWMRPSQKGGKCGETLYPYRPNNR